jgi:hypothetical protein
MKIQIQAQTLQIKNEIKFLYKKKQQLNKELYYIHTQNANMWKSIWKNTEESINQKLQKLKQNMKNNSRKYSIYPHYRRKQKTRAENRYYPRVINTTNIQFTQNEMQLLRKGLKYKLHYKQIKKIC